MSVRFIGDLFIFSALNYYEFREYEPIFNFKWTFVMAIVVIIDDIWIALEACCSEISGYLQFSSLNFTAHGRNN